MSYTENLRRLLKWRYPDHEIEESSANLVCVHSDKWREHTWAGNTIDEALELAITSIMRGHA